MHGGQRLPAACVITPVRQSRCRKIQPCWNLTLECVPCTCYVRRPEDGAIFLCAEVSIARENQAAMRRVAAEAVVDGTCVEERIDIEILRARTDVQITAIRRQVGLGFVGPDGVKAFAQNIFFNGVPVPVRGVRDSSYRDRNRPCRMAGHSSGCRRRDAQTSPSSAGSRNSAIPARSAARR